LPVRIEWFGQSAFKLTGDGPVVFIDPFGRVPGAVRARGVQFDYPEIAGQSADLLLVTHEHFDHNGVDGIEGSPDVIRSTAGKLDSPVGEVVAVASEHDPHAGTDRGPNTIFVFDLDGHRVCHFGDFGQSSLRDEQAEAIGRVDLMFLPVGGGPTIGAEGARDVIERLAPRWTVAMHFRTPMIGFLEPPDEFIGQFQDGEVARLDGSVFEVSDELPRVVVPGLPG
jgi:L-ascorbate metabolism protein UlaG (beta-lactamase superfamily)